MKFAWKQIKTAPVLDLSPDHTRMVTCFRDAKGIYHLFTDHIPAGMNTIHSWEAEIAYFRSRDLTTWESVGTAIARGPGGAHDSFGAASPHVLSIPETGRVYLFYAGRGDPRPGEPWRGLASPGESGYVSSRIMMASAPANEAGAPTGPFTDKRLIVDLDADWRNMRVDDPCALVAGGQVHLYFKGFHAPLLDSRQNVQTGCAVANLDDMAFAIRPGPILVVPGGGETPRFFRLGETWHLFLRHFHPAPGETHWQHHTSQDGVCWRLNDPRLFSRPHCPRRGPYDMAPIYGLDGALAKPWRALACGQDEDGVLKQWLYGMERLCPRPCGRPDGERR